jgi:hypothetical protein
MLNKQFWTAKDVPPAWELGKGLKIPPHKNQHNTTQYISARHAGLSQTQLHAQQCSKKTMQNPEVKYA